MINSLPYCGTVSGTGGHVSVLIYQLLHILSLRISLCNTITKKGRTPCAPAAHGFLPYYELLYKKQDKNSSEKLKFINL